MKVSLLLRLSLLAIIANVGLVIVDSRTKKKSMRYDYVVVGAGTAGSIVAADLATNFEDSTVLLIEEGYFANMNPIIDNLARANELLGLESIDRFYSTIEEPNLFNRIIPLSRAQVTGGCNSHNTNVYYFANENDFSRKWGNIQGWTLNDLIPIWEEIENITYSGLQIDDSNIWVQRLLQLGTDNGYEINKKPNDLSNGGTQSGIAPFTLQSIQINSSYIKRGSSYNAFIEPIIETQDNLDIIIATRVDKILFEQDDGEYSSSSSSNSDSESDSDDESGDDNNYKMNVYGIEVYNRGTFRREIIYVNKELIISAGTYDTPKLLMLSGVGECNLLENEYNIECLVDLPDVGKNLQDHSIHFIIGPPFTNATAVANEIPDDFASFGASWGVMAFSENGSFQTAVGFGDVSAFLAESESGAEGLNLFIGNVFNEVTSVGNVTLKNSDPSSKPVIFHNYFDTVQDKEKVIEHFKIGRRFFYNTSALDGLVFDETFEILPGYHVQSDKDILNYIKSGSTTGYHATSTCAINKVVDTKLKVFGFNNLRIADASVMPRVVSANTNQMTMVIGRKAANYIIDEYK